MAVEVVLVAIEVWLGVETLIDDEEIVAEVFVELDATLKLLDLDVVKDVDKEIVSEALEELDAILKLLDLDVVNDEDKTPVVVPEVELVIMVDDFDVIGYEL